MYGESAVANPDGKSRKTKNDVMHQKRMSENTSVQDHTKGISENEAEEILDGQHQRQNKTYSVTDKNS